MTLEEILSRINRVRKSGGGWVGLCPGHPDKNPSLSITERSGKILVKCFAGCDLQRILDALGLKVEDLFLRKRKKRGPSSTPPPGNGATAEQSQDGLTLKVLAEAKKLPENFLRTNGLRNVKYRDQPAVLIPYLTVSGELYGLRYRLTLDNEPRFVWRSGDRVNLYGLERLESTQRKGWTFLFEGESDPWTAWFWKFPAFGVPGKATWRPEWREFLKDLEVYVWIEPGADDFATRIARDLPDVLLVDAPPGIKDLSEAHIEGKDIPALIGELKKLAIPAKEFFKSKGERMRSRLQREAASILASEDPLELIRDEISKLGYGGDLNIPTVVYLAATSRLLKMRRGTLPVHLELLAVPSTGKSYAVTIVLLLLPQEAYHRIDAGSPRALIYDGSDLAHRVLLFDEIDSIPRAEDNPAASALRNLLQEHQLRYSVVIRDPSTSRWTTQEVVKPGPTVLITTGIKRAESQLDSRLFCLEVPDDFEQLRAALEVQGQIEINGESNPSKPLIAFQSLLQASAPWSVVVPFADQLSKLIQVTSSRTLRDFPRITSLIKTVTIIRHASRRKNNRGQFISTLTDYATVYTLINHMYAATTGPSQAVKAAVAAVGEIKDRTGVAATVSGVAKHLNISKTSASRRVNVALENDWLVNAENTKGKSYKLEIGEPLPDATGLPHPDRFTVSGDSGGDSEGDQILMIEDDSGWERVNL